MNALMVQFVQRSGLTLFTALAQVTRNVVVMPSLAAHLCFCSLPVQEVLA